MRPIRHPMGIERTALPPRTGCVDPSQAAGLAPMREPHHCGTAPDSDRTSLILGHPGTRPGHATVAQRVERTCRPAAARRGSLCPRRHDGPGPSPLRWACAGGPTRAGRRRRHLDRGDRGRRRRRGHTDSGPSGHGARRPLAPDLPHRLPRSLRVEHRHLDAERGARCVRLRSHALGHLRRRHHLRPVGADAAPADGGGPPGRQGGPAAVPGPPVPRAARVLPRGRARRPLPPSLEGPARGHGAPGGRRERHVRADLLGDPARARRQGGPARRHLAQLGPDERLPGHRPGHRRRALLARRAGLDLRRQRRDLPLRRRRPVDGDAARGPPAPRTGQPLAPADGRDHRGAPGQGGRPLPRHRVRVLAAGPRLHRADAGGGGAQPRDQPVQVGGLRDPLRLLRHGRPDRRHLHRDGLRQHVQAPAGARLPRRLLAVALRVRPATQCHSRRRERGRDGRVLLRVHHRAQHHAAGPRARERAWPGHGPVDDGLRRHRRRRQPADRAGGGRRRHHRPSCSSAPAWRSSWPGTPTCGPPRFRSCWGPSWPSRARAAPSCRACRSRPGAGRR